jgi:hypothetical protein
MFSIYIEFRADPALNHSICSSEREWLALMSFVSPSAFSIVIFIEVSGAIASKFSIVILSSCSIRS